MGEFVETESTLIVTRRMAKSDSGVAACPTPVPSHSAIPENRSTLKRRARVALIVETSLASGREVLQGITRYLREHRTWSVFYEPRSLAESVPGWLRKWDGDGIIARVSSPQIAQALLQTGIPVVDVLGMAPQAELPLVHLDDAAVAAVAANSFLEHNLRHFGFCGIGGANWSDRRGEAFAKSVGAAGHDCAFFRMHASLHEHWSWEREQDELATWLTGLPKPAGVTTFFALSHECNSRVNRS